MHDFIPAINQKTKPIVYDKGSCQRGENFIWLLRLAAVSVREAGSWKFVQMNFFFPTIYFPDVRVID